MIYLEEDANEFLNSNEFSVVVDLRGSSNETAAVAKAQLAFGSRSEFACGDLEDLDDLVFDWFSENINHPKKIVVCVDERISGFTRLVVCLSSMLSQAALSVMREYSHLASNGAIEREPPAATMIDAAERFHVFWVLDSPGSSLLN